MHSNHLNNVRYALLEHLEINKLVCVRDVQRVHLPTYQGRVNVPAVSQDFNLNQILLAV